MRAIPILLCTALVSIVVLFGLSYTFAQTAPAWELTLAPIDVYAGDQGTATITVAPGITTTETITIAVQPGLSVLSAQASAGQYANGVWTFAPAGKAATLTLTVLVLPEAQRAYDAYVQADWRGVLIGKSFDLHGPPPAPTAAAVAPRSLVFVPLIIAP